MSQQPASTKSQNGIAEPRRLLPRLHMAAYRGDLEATREALKAGDDLTDIVVLLNNNSQNVLGVTPLYLAAQEGHTEVCRLLLEWGADMNQKCCIPSTGEVFGPEDIALVRLHLKTYWFLAGRRAGVHQRGGVARSGSSGLWAIGSLFGITPPPRTAAADNTAAQPLLLQ